MNRRNIALAVLGIIASVSATVNTDDYYEKLRIQPMEVAGYKFIANFEFSGPAQGQLATDFLDQLNTSMLSLSFTQGRWLYNEWNQMPPFAAPSGVELIAETNPDSWKKLTHKLAGLFCASLQTMDSTRIAAPQISFQQTPAAKNRDKTIIVGSLPREAVCTENLTPWFRLLPCKTNAGIASLIDPYRAYDSQYHSMNIVIKRMCDSKKCKTILHHRLAVVIDHQSLESDRKVSLESLLGRNLTRICREIKHSSIEIATGTSEGWTALPVGQDFLQPDSKLAHFEFDHLSAFRGFSLQMSKHSPESPTLAAVPKLPLSVERHLTGYGGQSGGLEVELINQSDRPLRIIYMDTLPWFLKVYLHTLNIKIRTHKAATTNESPYDWLTKKDGTLREEQLVKRQFRQPALDRLRPTVLELELELPPYSTTLISVDFDKMLLRYTEYPPDANRGFDIGAGIVTLKSSEDGSNEWQRIYTQNLLVSLPTPDFSMPYNVITMTSTVIALFFGSLYNMLVRRFQPVRNVQPSILAQLKQRVSRLLVRRNPLLKPAIKTQD